MILTMEFLIAQNACPEGIEFAEKNNYIGMDYDAVIQDFVRIGELTHASGLLNYKKSELYVRTNGSIFTMGAYQVFNPLTGQHTRYETEAEAKVALVEVAKQVLEQHCPQVIQELSNENGDTTWIPTTMNETLVISAWLEQGNTPLPTDEVK